MADADLTYTQIEDAMLATFTAAAPLAVVVPQFVDGIEEGKNLDEVRSTADAGRIHSWQFAIGAIQRRVPTTHDYDIAGSKKTLRCDVTYTWLVKLFYEYRAAANTANANREANQAWINVAAALAERPRLGLTNRNFRQHFELQRESLALLPSSDVKIFLAIGRIDALVNEHFTVL